MGIADNEFTIGQNGAAVSGPFGVSWLAYLVPSFIFLVVLAGGVLLCQHSVVSGVVLIVVALALYAYHFLMLRSIRLYADEMGVWAFRGILPWAKGVSGVKWRDLDEAVFYQSFFGWVFKSYTLRIGHRFTRGSEIVAANIFRGDMAVREINQHHMDLIRQGVIEDMKRGQ